MSQLFCYTSIVGARPQFVKLSPIIRALQSYEDIHHFIIHTGQHYDYLMNKVFFDELGLPEPRYNLEVGSASHGVQTGLILSKVEDVLVNENPDWVLLYGDTNSTLAGALAAAKLDIPVAHIEAGLRSYNKCMPEEINRILTDHISTILFCPTVSSTKNLERESFRNVFDGGMLTEESSIRSSKLIADRNNPFVINVGDVMYDAMLLSLNIARDRSKIMDILKIESKGYYLATIHRAENTDDDKRLCSILEAFNEIADDKEIILPLHPRTRKKMREIGDLKINPRVRICEPVGYFDMLILEQNADRIFTDSGGVQKEAYFFGVPCITLRDQTEWVETVDDGMNIVTGASKAKIVEASNKTHNPKLTLGAYGDGKASERILLTLLNLAKTCSISLA